MEYRTSSSKSGVHNIVEQMFMIRV